MHYLLTSIIEYVQAHISVLVTRFYKGTINNVAY